MLRNLHLMFREKQDVGRRLDVVELSLRLEPWNATLVGERGMLYYRLGEPGRALDDLQQYVGAVSPGSVATPRHAHARTPSSAMAAKAEAME